MKMYHGTSTDKYNKMLNFILLSFKINDTKPIEYV